MRALAWDDKPNGYISSLKEPLKAIYNINLETVSDTDKFSELFFKNRWHFIMIDIVHPSASEDSTGIQLLEDLQKNVKGRNIPTFVITDSSKYLQASSFAPNVIPRHRSKFPHMMVDGIYWELAQRNLYANHSRLFLIRGKDRQADGATERVQHYLTSKGLTVHAPNDDNTGEADIQELMNHCGAFVAICTPDEKSSEDDYHISRNAVLRIGLAMGLMRGTQRLVIMQRWGPSPAQQAKLSSDLTRMHPIQFSDIGNALEPLRARLISLDMELIDKD